MGRKQIRSYCELSTDCERLLSAPWRGRGSALALTTVF